ncbi:MAG: hydroxymethylglutaryl-CoA lyase [Shewanellaceae bacterium]|nr:hydroxymethylglutaryl-CoA lyase [Shewanellaceae bacterium]
MNKQQAHIVEVGARDGLQNEPPLDIATRVAFINKLSATGLRHIEAGSFVSPKWVPQMADSTAVLQQIERVPTTTYSALIPNQQGLTQALAVKVTEVAIFIAATDPFNQKNLNQTTESALRHYESLIQTATDQGLAVRGYISCVLGCPYSGSVLPETVSQLAKQLYDMGCYQISLGDTIGIGTAVAAQTLVAAVSRQIPTSAIALHFHNTYGQALANIQACLELGVHTFDSSVAGLGGCPFAPGASGNLPTEDLVYFLQGQGIDTGIDLNQLVQVGDFICRHLNRGNQSNVANALLSQTNTDRNCHAQ